MLSAIIKNLRIYWKYFRIQFLETKYNQEEKEEKMIPELRENTNTVIFDIGNVLIYFAWKEYLESLKIFRRDEQACGGCYVL